MFWLDSGGERRSYGTLEPGGQRRQNTYAGHVWLAADAEGNAIAVYQAVEQQARALVGVEAAPVQNNRPEPPERGVSPDGRWRAFIRGHNLWLRDEQNERTFQLSTDGTAEDAYTGRIFWSPDSAKLAVIRRQPAQERKVYLIESSPRDQVQPKLHSYDYLKPGDRVTIDKPQLFDITSRSKVPVSDALFDNPYNIYDIRWQADSSRFTFFYNQRGHQVLRLVAVDADTGDTSAVIDERSDTFICYSSKLFCEIMDSTDEIIWMSERDGWNHLYLYDAQTGSVKNQITKGQWVVRSVDRVDKEKRQIWFWAGGIHDGQDPYYLHYARVNFDGSGLTVLTEGDGTHTVRFSPDRRYYVAARSRVDLPPVHELRCAEDGRLICELERGDATALHAAGWQAPEPFVAKGRDGLTDIYGVIIRPTTFDPNQSYPIIENIYAGPQGAFVPKSFQPYYNMMELAELGFILVQIDGMGTSYRSKAFHDVCWQNLADAGLPDRVLWIKAAAEKYPYMDSSRVGIYGGSAGGQNAAAAVMTHGDFYKAAVADCGCHDNRMDKMWWNEQWMGWPVGPHYAANSNVTLAPGLKGKLLLIVGEMDRNVDPASTMQVVDALIRANKDFEMLVIPGAGHGAAEGRYASRRRADFLVRHLLGVESRRE
ncbi:MAG: prolyl oligopeptidase family serine peptidase [Phycisphaerae bacterium]|nr:prolyl oligopeptidase family serine peptidase [Phycisphaerae bacterium]